MAIVKMRKLHLVAMSYAQDALLNALHRTGAVQVTVHSDLPDTDVPTADTEALRTELASLENALTVLSAEVENYDKTHGNKSEILGDGFDVPYGEFISAHALRPQVDKAVADINACMDEKNALKAEIVRLERQIENVGVYAQLHLRFSDFSDTQKTRVRLGIVANSQKDAFENALKETELCVCESLASNGDNALYAVFAHRSVAETVNATLSAFAFSDCPYTDGRTGRELYAECVQAKKDAQRALTENLEKTYALRENIRTLKVYFDYLSFVLEKQTTTEKFRATDKTFFMEAFVPEYAEEAVKTEIKAVANDAVYLEFTEPTETDEPPTLLKNNKLVESFEDITNTYSAPNYREFDPNAVMAFFYSLFMGFIIGDAGYGLVMLLGGGLIWWKNRARPTTMSRLAGAFAVGGVFAVVWGLLFNSLFGFPVLGKANTLMPNPQTDMWSLAGISVPAVLIISMLIGVVQLCTGYICSAVQCWRRGEIGDAICGGVLWAFFSVGVGLAIIGFVEEAGVPLLGTIGGITAGASLLLAMITAGRKEKFFGKITKGFGTAYGIINYASDILSYARLYGLMLSGAVIAGIIAQYSGDFILSGNIGLIALGVVLLIVGNGFNLVMNLLGAYIHDARLQYVEFYGRFFEGEGELFKPLGSGRKYVSLLPANNE